MKVQEVVDTLNTIDWEKWMEDHHIKIGGKSHDNGSDAVQTGDSVSGTKVEAQVPNNAGSTR